MCDGGGVEVDVAGGVPVLIGVRLVCAHTTPLRPGTSQGRSPQLVCPVLFRRVSKQLASTIDEARANNPSSADGCRVPEFERCSAGVQSVECRLRWTAGRDKDRNNEAFSRLGLSSIRLSSNLLQS